MDQTIEIPNGHEAVIEGNKVIIRERYDNEAIRDFLYEFIKVCGWSEKQYPPREKCLAYLEKKKEYVSKNFDEVWEREDCSDIIAEGKKLTPEFEALFKKVCHAFFDKGVELTKKQKEQKPVPKFYVGDYVIDTNYKGEPLYQIMYIDKECYICEYRGDKAMGDRAVMHFAFDNPYLRLEQQPSEWSKEDDAYRRLLIAILEFEHPNGIFSINASDVKIFKSDVVVVKRIIDWLKSLRPQPSWKPSEEQMIELMHAISGCSFETPVLESLYEQLKSL